MGLIEQTVSDWGDWPDDVRDRLRSWNADFLLSFRRTGDFLCFGCHRAISSHPQGNAVVRPKPKAKGSLFCETCLVALARTYDTPPPNTERDVSYRGAIVRAEGREQALRALRERDQAVAKRLRRQLAIDQIFIDELEKLVDPEKLVALRDRLRGVHRRSR